MHRTMLARVKQTEVVESHGALVFGTPGTVTFFMALRCSPKDSTLNRRTFERLLRNVVAKYIRRYAHAQKNKSLYHRSVT